MPKRPDTCSRCGAELTLNHDEVFCWVHGLQWEPMRAWDLSDDEFGIMRQMYAVERATKGCRDCIAQVANAERVSRERPTLARLYLNSKHRMCIAHHRAFLAAGGMKVCNVDTCDDIAHSGRYCYGHRGLNR